MSETSEYRVRLAAEYGQFVAIAPIRHNGVLAYAEGTAVPASNVALHGYDDLGLVERVADATEPEETLPDPGNATAPTGDPVDLTKAPEGAGTEG